MDVNSGQRSLAGSGARLAVNESGGRVAERTFS